MRLLVVDDDGGLCGAIRDSLRTSVPGLEVAADGRVRDAIQRLASGFHPDVALVDLFLPDGSGLDVAARLRSHGVRRVVGMTGQERPPLDEILELFDDFLLKPFELRELERLFAAPPWCYLAEGCVVTPVSRTAR